MEIVLSAANFLNFTNQATSNIKWKHIRHTLRLGDKLETNLSLQVVSSRLWLHQVATLTKILHVSAGNSLAFSNVVIPRALLSNAESGLPIAHWTSAYISHPANSTFIIDQEASVEVVKYVINDIINFAQTVSFELIKGAHVNHAFILSHGVSVYKENKNFIGPYNG
jgi:hypothetical protein